MVYEKGEDTHGFHTAGAFRVWRNSGFQWLQVKILCKQLPSMWGPEPSSVSGAQAVHSCQKSEGCWKCLQKHWEDKHSGNKLNVLYLWKATTWEEEGEGTALLRNEALVTEALGEVKVTITQHFLLCWDTLSLISISVFCWGPAPNHSFKRASTTRGSNLSEMSGSSVKFHTPTYAFIHVISFSS